LFEGVSPEDLQYLTDLENYIGSGGSGDRMETAK
jgi:hypothetical protein